LVLKNGGLKPVQAHSLTLYSRRIKRTNQIPALVHPPYLPGLVLCNLFMFPKLTVLEVSHFLLVDIQRNVTVVLNGP